MGNTSSNTARPYYMAMQNSIQGGDSTHWIELFCQRTMSMIDYSVDNVARVLTQMPSATYVAGEEKFAEEGAYLLKDALGLRILAPSGQWRRNQKADNGFREPIVYDISHTTAVSKSYKTPDNTDVLEKAVSLASKAGIQVLQANISQGKVYEKKTLYIKQGLPSKVFAQLIIHELCYLALRLEYRLLEPTMAFAMAVVASYCVMVGLHVKKVPNIEQKYKLTLCLGNGLHNNLKTAIGMGRRVYGKLKRL